MFAVQPWHEHAWYSSDIIKNKTKKKIPYKTEKSCRIFSLVSSKRNQRKLKQLSFEWQNLPEHQFWPMAFFSWNKWRLYHSIIEKETLGLSQFSPFTDFLREREKMFYTYSRPMKFVEYEFQAVFPIIFSMDLLHTPFCLHVLHRIGETIFVLLFNFAPHFLCWILGVVPFNTRGGNLQNDIYFTQNGRSCHFEWK